MSPYGRATSMAPSRGCLVSLAWAGVTIVGLGDMAGHLKDGGEVDHGGVGLGKPLVVAGAAAAAGYPGVGVLDDPAAGQGLEHVPGALRAAGDDLDGDAGLAPCPVLPGVAVAGGTECPRFVNDYR